MCGIAGILNAGEGSLEATERMVAAMGHRGPDDRGTVEATPRGARVVLGNARLAIIDLSAAGHMPMQDPESGNWITYNGEVYNFPALRCELEASGEQFRSGTDTEVLLKAHRKWGMAFVDRLQGMFAFALWDATQQELILARDRAGKKPLYYANLPSGGFVFASEVRALLASGLVERRLDRAGLEIYLWNGFLVSPRTLVEGVRGVMPGTWMRIDREGVIRETVRYWQLPRADRARPTDAGTLEGLRAALAESVRLRLISDVPLGAFLSGGLDSSTTVALMARGSAETRTFSIAFEETEFDESPYARWVAERFHTRHTEVRLGRGQFLGWLEDALGGMDQPTYDGINSYCVSRVARESGLTVALSGAGGDELFGGYPFFDSARWVATAAAVRGRIPMALRGAVESWFGAAPRGVAGGMKVAELLDASAISIRQAMPILVGYQVSQMMLPGWVRRRLLAGGVEAGRDVLFGLPSEYARFLEEELTGREPIEQVSAAAWRLFLAERCLRDIDTMSMAVSLEVRAPLVDQHFVESVFAVPGQDRCRGVPDKPFEWNLVRPIVGADYPYRAKRGFLLPFEVWMQDPSYQARVLETLSDRKLVGRAGLEPEGVGRLGAAFTRPGSDIPWSRVWSIFVLLRWCSRNGIRAS
jgi:asparagine synthase (glutamine-hydrolysing)